MKKLTNKINLILFPLLISLVTGCAAGLVQTADSNFKKKNYHKSAELYAEYLKQHPGSFLTRRKYGRALLKDNRPEQAAKQLEKVIEDYPHDYKSLLYLGLAYLQSEKYRQALEVWDRYVYGGKPLIAEEVEEQSELMDSALPDISRELALDIKSAIEGAINAQKLRDAYNASRLEECAGG